MIPYGSVRATILLFPIGKRAALIHSQTTHLKSPDLKHISHTGLVFTSDVICNVDGLFG